MDPFDRQRRSIEAPRRPQRPRSSFFEDQRYIPSTRTPTRYDDSRSRYEDTPFSYEDTPLTNPSTQIRLFRILPSSEHGLHCSMRTHSLPCPPNVHYSAMSYMWEPDETKGRYRVIQLNGRSHVIGENLWLFLNKLDAAGETGYLWADALSINQQNISERNAQVAVMSKIYHGAQRVLCWIGQEAEGSGRLVRRMNGRKGMDHRYWDLTEDGAEMWEALQDFCRRPYWSRMWIIPEVLSRPQDRVVLFCGDDSVTLKTFHDVCDFALDVLQSGRRRSSSRRENFHTPPGWKKGQVAAMETEIRNSNTLHLSHKCGHTSLWELLERHGNAGCLDPRDKVYALLSTARDTNYLGCPLRPDYGKGKRVLVSDVLAFCGREDVDSLRALVGWMLPGERVDGSFEEWARQWPVSIGV